MNLPDRRFSQFPEIGIERDGMPATLLPIEKGAFRYFDLQHLLEAQPLGAELNFVATVALRLAPFVLDGKDSAILMELHHVGLPGEAETTGADRQGSHRADPALLLRLPAVRPLVQHPPLGGEAVFDPDLFQMDQSALSRAIEIVLQGGEHDVVGFGVHAQPFLADCAGAMKRRRRAAKAQQVIDI